MALRVVPKLMSGELDDPDALTPKVLSDLRTLTSESVVRGLAVLFGVEPAILYQLPQLPPEPCHCSKCGRMIEDEKDLADQAPRDHLLEYWQVALETARLTLKWIELLQKQERPWSYDPKSRDPLAALRTGQPLPQAVNISDSDSNDDVRETRKRRAHKPPQLPETPHEKPNQRYRARPCRRNARPSYPDTAEPSPVTLTCRETEDSSAETSINEPRIKIKSRPAGRYDSVCSDASSSSASSSNESSSPIELHDPGVPASAVSPLEHLSTASKATFLRLFAPNPTTKKPLPFSSFAAAMIEAGFTASHAGRCAGSAVTFKDVNGEHGGRSITFHRPHPDPSVDHHKLRTWGKRLEKKFGWEGWMFADDQAD